MFFIYLFTIFKEGKTHLAIRLVYHVALCNTTNRKHLYTIYTNMKKTNKYKSITLSDVISIFICNKMHLLRMLQSITQRPKTNLVMRQTACLVVNPIKVNSFAYLLLHDGRSDLRLNDGTILHLT